MVEFFECVFYLVLVVISIAFFVYSKRYLDKPSKVEVLAEELNDLLLSLENAAHDAFVTDDPNIDYDENAISAHTSLLKVIKNYILEHTKIDDGEDQKIEGLSEILAVF